MSKFAEFAETKKFKTIMNYIYSLGAAVVIAGALFKIQHWPGANLMLNIGMGTEVFVFCIFAIDPTQVHMDLDWSLVYPELAGMHDEHAETKEDKGSITEQLDNMLEEAKIGPELIESLGSGLKNLSDNASKLTSLSDASVATSRKVHPVFIGLNCVFRRYSDLWPTSLATQLQIDIIVCRRW